MARSLTKVIVWGFPLHTHTHSYVHAAWVKAFQAIKTEVHWFHDGEHPDPATFDYSNALVITEGYADDRLPVLASNVYVVHVCRNPAKYLDAGARLIDLRYHMKSINDYNYVFDLEAKSASTVRVSDATIYEAAASSDDLSERYRLTPKRRYEAIYMYWATNLLPNEIQLDDRFIEPDVPLMTVFVGTISPGNATEIEALRRGCNQAGIRVAHVDPWRNPVSFEEGRRLVQRSIIAPDIRGSGDPSKVSLGETGTCHKKNGYVACRLFKSISYGKLGATNSKAVLTMLGDEGAELVVCDEDETRLVDACMRERGNHDLVRRQMEWVRDFHTYISRIDDLVHVLTLAGDGFKKKKYSFTD